MVRSLKEAALSILIEFVVVLAAAQVLEQLSMAHHHDGRAACDVIVSLAPGTGFTKDDIVDATNLTKKQINKVIDEVK